jgi:hypothetical protein
MTAALKQTSDVFMMVPKSGALTTVTLPQNVITRASPLAKIPGYTSVTGAFNTTLSAGNSYTLHLSFWAPIWAGSNIYWSGNASAGKLTFALSDVKTYQGYQGVFFKWGSLVGISPLGNFVNNSTPTYNGLGESPSKSATWEGIPYWDPDTYGDVIDATKYALSLGDICRYLGAKYATLAGYRLPTAAEFGVPGSSSDFNTTTPVLGGWVKGAGTYAGGTANAFGTVDFTSLGFAKNTTMDNVSIPVSGGRDYYGYVSEVGKTGSIWSSSPLGPSHPNYAYFFHFKSDIIYTSMGVRRDWALPVRCVKV